MKTKNNGERLDEVVAVYSHVDRMVTLGCRGKKIRIDVLRWNSVLQPTRIAPTLRKERREMAL